MKKKNSFEFVIRLKSSFFCSSLSATKSCHGNCGWPGAGREFLKNLFSFSPDFFSFFFLLKTQIFKFFFCLFCYFWGVKGENGRRWRRILFFKRICCCCCCCCCCWRTPLENDNLSFFFVLFALNIFLGLPSSSSCWKVGSRKRKKIFCGQPFDTKETTWEIKKEPRVGGRNYNLCINQRAVETGIIDKCGLKKDIKTHLIVINNTHGPALDGLVGFIFFLFFL